MQILAIVFIFAVVLFFYLHLYFHLKTSNDLEIYEITQPTKDKLEEICDLRQPVLFDFEGDKTLMNTVQLDSLVSTFGAFDVNVKEETETVVPLKLNTVLPLLQDPSKRYLSENNWDFIDETGLKKQFRFNETLVKPPFTVQSDYDILLASENVSTPLRYELNYRTYFLVTQGEITIKLAPPSSTRYLFSEPNYEEFVFESPVNIWSVQDKYKGEVEKVNCLEFTMRAGQIVFIPAYWWYSIRFNMTNSLVASFRYKTMMNTMAIIPSYVMHVLQINNVIHKVAKHYDNVIIRKPDEDTPKQKAKEEEKEKEKEEKKVIKPFSMLDSLD